MINTGRVGVSSVGNYTDPVARTNTLVDLPSVRKSAKDVMRQNITPRSGENINGTI